MRSERGEIRARVRSGDLTPADVMVLVEDGDLAARGITVFRLLTAVHGCGPSRATALLAALAIPANRKLGGLSDVQSRQLIAVLRYYESPSQYLDPLGANPR